MTRPLLAALLALVLVPAFAGVPTQMPLEPERGRTLYRENCWMCHGWTGEGNGPIAASLGTTPPPLAGRLAESDWEDHIQLIQGGRGDMPSYAQVFDRHDSRKILVWLATLDPNNPHDAADDEAKKKAAEEEKKKADKAKKKPPVKPSKPAPDLDEPGGGP